MTREQINNNKFNNIRNLKIDLGIFKGGERITQRFNDKEGLKYIQRLGHDGLDLVPFVAGNNDIYSPIEGTVIFQGWDSNYPFASRKKFWGYGLFVIIYDNKNNLLWLFGHLSNINVKHNQRIKVGDLIGKMGRSGFGILNRYPLHLHLGRYEVDNNIKILNQENGFWGGTDPLILLDEKNNIENMKLNNIIKALSVSNIEDKANIIHSLKEYSNDDTYIVRVLEALQNNYKSALNSYNKLNENYEILEDAYSDLSLKQDKIVEAELKNPIPKIRETNEIVRKTDSEQPKMQGVFNNFKNVDLGGVVKILNTPKAQEKVEELKTEIKKGKRISWKKFTFTLLALLSLTVPHLFNTPEMESLSKALTENNLQYVILLIDAIYLFFQSDVDKKNG